MTNENTNRHDQLYIMGSLGKNDASLWIHSNGNLSNLLFIVCVECNGKEWDFRNVKDAWQWFYDERERQKKCERAKRNSYARKRYWKQHTTFM